MYCRELKFLKENSVCLAYQRAGKMETLKHSFPCFLGQQIIPGSWSLLNYWQLVITGVITNSFSCVFLCIVLCQTSRYLKHLFGEYTPKYCFAGRKCYSFYNIFENIGSSWYARFAIVSILNASSYCVWNMFMISLRYLRKL